MPLGLTFLFISLKGALNYTEPDTQMMMIKQFEDVAATSRVSDLDTEYLWMSNLLLWTTRLCSENFDREDFGRPCVRPRQGISRGQFCL